MNRSKLLFTLIIGFFVLFSFSSCGDEKADKAEETVNIFFKAIEEHDFVKAKEYATAETQKVLDIVITEAEKYKKYNDKKVEIKFEILEKIIVEENADIKVKITIGEVVKDVMIKMSYVRESWFIIMPKSQLTIFRYIVFYNNYDLIIVVYNKEQKVIIWITALMLFGGLADLPYGYYQLLRFIVCGVSIYVAYTAYNRQKLWVVWLFGFVALLFNPLILIYLSKEIWQPIDVICASLFIAMPFILKKKK